VMPMAAEPCTRRHRLTGVVLANVVIGVGAITLRPVALRHPLHVRDLHEVDRPRTCWSSIQWD